MATGTVTWINPTKGVGFIAPDQNQRTVICLIAPDARYGLESLRKGQKVSFDNTKVKNGKLIYSENLELID